MDTSKYKKVIDVSRWQGFINWPVVAKNIDLAMIKVGGSDDGFYMDGQAQRNLIEARSAGLPLGTYYFLGGEHTIQEEVQHIVNLYAQLGGVRAGEPIALDWEKRRKGLDEVGYLTGIVEGISRRGLPSPIIYMNLNYVRTQNWQNLVTRNCPLWIAAWGDNDALAEANEKPPSDEWPHWLMWQYSSTGSVPGIAGRVDCGLLNGSVANFQKAGLSTDFKLSASPSPVPQVLPAQGAISTYVVVRGDNLSAIAARYGRTWQALYALNRDKISNPNRIFPGQKIRIWSGGPSNPQLPTTTHQPTNSQKFYTVKNGDNLSVIAARYHLSSWNTLYDMNRDIIGANPNLIHPGLRLRIP